MVLQIIDVCGIPFSENLWFFHIVHFTPYNFTHYVLGFSPTYDNYKVLVYRLKHDEYEQAMAVYSLRNHLWTIKINPMNVDAWTSLRAPEASNKCLL